MLLNLTCLITIGQLVLNFVHEVEITSGWTERTDIAVIRLPKKIYVKQGDVQRQTIDQVVKTGDRVEIRLGYNGKLRTEFRGYVASSPAPRLPLEITCEDEMFQLKRKQVKSRTFESATVSQLISYIAPGYKTEVLNSQLGKFAIGTHGPETASQILDRLESEAGLRSFFRYDSDGEPVLVVGKPYLWVISEQAPVLPEVIYVLAGKQGNTVGNTLKYVRSEDRRVKVQARLLKDDGKTIKAKFEGDVDGEVRTLHYYAITEEELEKKAREDYQRFKRDGYDGDIVGFGWPHTQSGQIVQVVDTMYEQRKARFFIDRVKVNFGVSGFRRTNTIGFSA